MSPCSSSLFQPVLQDQGSPAQQSPNHAGQGDQQQGTGDCQHRHKPGWWVPHCHCTHDDQWLPLQRLCSQQGEEVCKAQGS